MSSRATIADVAQQAGVSIATVSRALNKTGPVASPTAARVETAVHALNYIPHPAARGLASKKTTTIGLILPGISGSFFAPMLRGIEACVRENGFDLLIYSTQNQPGQGSPRHPLGEHNSDGLLIFTNSLDTQELTRLHQANFPLVLLHQSPPAGLSIPSITFENKAGARQLMEHLIVTHGRRRIAFLAGPSQHEDSHWREMGYKEALAVHDLPYDPALVAVGGFNQEQGRTAVAQWLDEGVEIDAIFAADDDSASGALTALRQAGQRVPEKMAVVGFDDLPFARHLLPPLTTVRAPIERAGREAAQQLFHLIRSEPAEPQTLLPTELIIRRSCGCRPEMESTK